MCRHAGLQSPRGLKFLCLGTCPVNLFTGCWSLPLSSSLPWGGWPYSASPELPGSCFHLSWEMAAGNCSFGGQRGMVMFSLLPPWRRLLTRWSSLYNFRCNSKHTIPTLAPSASFNYGWERLRRPDSHGSAWSPAEAWVLNHLKLYLLLFKNRTTSRNGRSGLPTQKTRGWTTFVLDTSI